MQNVSLMPAFILHTRRFRETSLLLDVWSQDDGRVSLIAKGGQRPNRRIMGLLQPFIPLLVSWVGRSELMTLTQVESLTLPFNLRGNALICGFYLNELLGRVLKQNDPHPNLYEIYHRTLKNLSQSVNIPRALRMFEKHVLAELGYGLPLTRDLEGSPIKSDARYQYFQHRGFKLHPEGEFSGASLLALAQEQLETKAHFYESKRLLQLALSPLLGPKPIKSRELLCY